MAHYSTDHQAFRPIPNPISRIFAAIGNALVLMSTSNDRMRQVDALQALSDEDLAKRGLKRDEIARYVFNDVFWH
ncbi:DUF1127 domain-containing protein [Sedimentitalea nanhaiensis]|uniref:DUF1127 domain-containing protein n=1 Tax=Sedimentitalea nanhaiensis TaxID=999627 RepID=A0A1I6X6I5_9RHOB|nr:DUF1127 domain-containing protein [Sedimentitalea nanhaiensis]SFT33859.1 protein of unknown function [Sedimentitalea nanhaiensis]